MFQLFVLVLIHGTVSAERRQLNHVNSGVKRCCYQQVSFLAIEKDSQKIKVIPGVLCKKLYRSHTLSSHK